MKTKTSFNRDRFYELVAWPVFRNNLSEGQYAGMDELLDYCEGWSPAETASALVLAYASTDGAMFDAIIRRIKYREPVARQRAFELAHGPKLAVMALCFQDALLSADWS